MLLNQVLDLVPPTHEITGQDVKESTRHRHESRRLAYIVAFLRTFAGHLSDERVGERLVVTAPDVLSVL